ncbi:hypothetical protein PAXRUDRAFT_138864 [Paxillus rubicundulus Ve08.2h10]|uniref:Uncharacterized protein n=1 Tax=Paxillus rubicundulus Ve08.2h10 TaxID=930991 RepID=A0A0D0EA10_9AGAM|nr:hypothetical protein PAXRUDRAFT_138864 [Paxillus rubicundulus Ve08.2h10]
MEHVINHWKLDIIVLHTPLTATPIFQYHSMAVMNYFSADTIFSAYPFITFNNLLINPTINHFSKLSLPTFHCDQKYHDRGFNIMLSVQSYSHEVVTQEKTSHMW